MLKILCSKDFLLKLDDFMDYSINDLEYAKETDIESIIFFKTIIFEKASVIHIDLSEEKIIEYKSKRIDELPEEERDIARIIKRTSRRFLSDSILYNSLKSQNTNGVQIQDLPHYLFLDAVGKDICIDIEKKFGIHCYSTKRFKVEPKFRRVELIKLDNTTNNLFSKINSENYNTIEIDDQYFFKNCSNQNIASEVVRNLLNLNGYALSNLKFSIKTRLKEIDQRLFETRKVILENELSNSISNYKINSNITLNGQHDRYLNTNRSINIIGTSLFSNQKTHFTSYPIGIYYDFFD